MKIKEQLLQYKKTLFDTILMILLSTHTILLNFNFTWILISNVYHDLTGELDA